MSLAASWFKKSCGLVPREEFLEDGRAWPKEDGNQFRAYQALHEENFLSGWLREDEEKGKAATERLFEEAKQQESKSGKREIEREGEMLQT